jgi:hypothetical protein
MLSVENMEPAAAVATLRQALEGLNTLSGQRAALEEALKVRMTACWRWLSLWLLGCTARPLPGTSPVLRLAAVGRAVRKTS